LESQFGRPNLKAKLDSSFEKPIWQAPPKRSASKPKGIVDDQTWKLFQISDGGKGTGRTKSLSLLAGKLQASVFDVRFLKKSNNKT
jgi:hypothetical protein